MTLKGDADRGTVMLTVGRTITCWTCGSEVHKGRIEEIVDQLRALRQEKSAQRNQLEAEIADLTEDLESLEAAHEQRQHLESRREEVTQKIETRESTVERLEQRRDELAERVADLESDIEARQGPQQDELLELQAEVSQLEVERDRTAERVEEVEAQLRDIDDELAASDDLEREREEISEQLQELRTRVDRIWIEPTQQEVTDGRERVSEEALEVHVVRETARECLRGQSRPPQRERTGTRGTGRCARGLSRSRRPRDCPVHAAGLPGNGRR